MSRPGPLLSDAGRGALYGVSALILFGLVLALIFSSGKAPMASQFPEGWECQNFGKGASYCSAPQSSN
jgi:hypothetical protein